MGWHPGEPPTLWGDDGRHLRTTLASTSTAPASSELKRAAARRCLSALPRCARPLRSFPRSSSFRGRGRLLFLDAQEIRDYASTSLRIPDEVSPDDGTGCVLERLITGVVSLPEDGRIPVIRLATVEFCNSRIVCV